MATIKVKSTLDSRNYKKGIDQMKKKNSKFAKGLSSVKGKIAAAFAIGAIIGAVRALARFGMAVVNAGSKLSDLSAQTGVNVEDLNALNDAALNAGSSAEKMTKALVSLTDAQGEVLDGDKLMTDAFTNLGISIDEVASMNTVQLFERVSQALTDSGNSSKELSAVFDILGKRNAMELTEAMNEIAGGMDNIKRAGIEMSEFDAQSLDLLADTWERRKKSFIAGSAEIFTGIFGGSRKHVKEVYDRIETSERRAKIEAESRAHDLAELKMKNEKNRLEIVAKAEEKEVEKQKKADLDRINKIKEIEQSTKIDIKADSIRKIGGMAGSSVSQSLNYARKQTEMMAEMAQYEASLPKIEENTKNQGLL